MKFAHIGLCNVWYVEDRLSYHTTSRVWTDHNCEAVPSQYFSLILLMLYINVDVLVERPKPMPHLDPFWILFLVLGLSSEPPLPSCICTVLLLSSWGSLGSLAS